MAEKQNPGFVEQIREMRALRTQQLRGMTADQRFYNNMNANQRALVQASQKLGASFDSMSKTFSSSLRGLSSAVGGLASKGASAAGNVAGGAASIAGSLASGIGKVLPFAIAGLLGKIFVYDNLTSDTKNRLSSSIGNLFSTLFGGLPDMFKGIIQKIVNSVSKMDIKFPILNTIMEKTEILMKMFGAGIELAKLKLEDLMEFFDGIKDPMKIFESGLKAMGAATLSRLLLPATVSLVASIIGNRLLMGQIGDALDSRGVGGGRGRGAGRRARRAANAAGGVAAISASRVAAGTTLAGTVAKKIGIRLGAGAALAAIPVFGQLLLAGYTAYELYEIAVELGFTEEEAAQLSEPEQQTDAMSFYGERKATDLEVTAATQAKQELPTLQSDLRKFESGQGMFKPGGAPGTSSAIAYDNAVADLKDQIKTREALIYKGDNETRRKYQIGEEKSVGGDLGVQSAFNRIWNQMSKFEKQSAIDLAIPIIETETFVYLMGSDRKIKKMTIEEYRKLRNDLDPQISEIDRAEFERMTGKVIMKNESASNYNAVYGMGKTNGSILPPKNLTEMSGEEVLAYQEQLRKSTAGKIGQGDKGTSAVGAYQLTKSNVTDPYYAKFPEEKGKLFNEEQQDKIYRWFINDAVNQFMATGDKKAFSDYVTSKWEIFSKDPKAKKELDALLDNPVFTADASDSTKKLTKEERAKKEKLLTNILGKYSDQLMAAGSTVPATVGGRDVVSETVGVVKNEVTQAMEFFQKLKPDFKNDATDLKKSETNSSPIINQNITNAPVSVVNSSSGGGGGAPSIGSVISGNMGDRNWQFNALAGSSTK